LDKVKINSYKLLLFLVIIFSPSFFYFSKNISNIVFINFSLLLLIVTFKKEIINLKISKNFLIGFIFILIQMIPINSFFLEIISPKSNYYYSLLSEEGFRFISLNPLLTLKFLIIYSSCYLIYLITPMLIKNKRELKKVLQIIIFFGFIHASYGLVMNTLNLNDYYFYKKISNFNSVSGFFINRNHFAFLILIIFITSLTLIQLNQKYFNKVSFKSVSFFLSDNFIIRVIILLFALALILTKSRTGNFSFVSLIVILIIYEWIKNRKLNLLIVILLSIIILDFLIITFIFGIDGVATRFVETSIESERRFPVFHFGINQILNFPIFGYGLGNFETIYRLEIQDNQFFYDHTHNDFIEYVGEIGLIGFFIFGIFFYKFIKKVSQKNILNEIKFLIFSLLILILIHGNLDFALHMPQIIYIVTFIFSLAECKIKKTNSN